MIDYLNTLVDSTFPKQTQKVALFILTSRPDLLQYLAHLCLLAVNKDNSTISMHEHGRIAGVEAADKINPI